MATHYKALCPATDWFFVQEGDPPAPVVFRVAAWAILEGDAPGDSDTVIGLVSAFPGGQASRPVARLSMIPAAAGRYKHWSALSPDERARVAGAEPPVA